jgi:hypothetical protein
LVERPVNWPELPPVALAELPDGGHYSILAMTRGLESVVSGKYAGRLELSAQ